MLERDFQQQICINRKHIDSLHRSERSCKDLSYNYFYRGLFDEGHDYLEASRKYKRKIARMVVLQKALKASLQEHYAIMRGNPLKITVTRSAEIVALRDALALAVEHVRFMQEEHGTSPAGDIVVSYGNYVMAYTKEKA